jgi:hypothetical protein
MTNHRSSNVEGNGAGGYFPAPSGRNLGWWKAEPMRIWEAELIVASYNEWVEEWNRHECDRTLPIGPRWSLANCPANARPRNTLVFVRRRDDIWGAIRAKGWNAWAPSRRPYDGCFIRNRLDIGAIMWAGWRLPRPMMPRPMSLQDARACYANDPAALAAYLAERGR